MYEYSKMLSVSDTMFITFPCIDSNLTVLFCIVVPQFTKWESLCTVYVTVYIARKSLQISVQTYPGL